MTILEIHARSAAIARLDDGDFEQIKILKYNVNTSQVKQPLVMQKKEPKDSSN